MDIASFVPVADAIPVHWFWLQSLLTATTFLHLVAMNVLLGSGIIALVIMFRRGEAARPLSCAVAESLPYSMALTVNLGVAPLLFVQVLYGQFFYTSSVLMAKLWFVVFALLLIAYSLLYLHKVGMGTSRTSLTFLTIAVLMLLVISFIFANNISLMQLPENWLRYFDQRAGWLITKGDPVFLPRLFHFLASAVAMGGLAIAVYFEFRRRRGDGDTDQWIRLGSTWFALTTGINFGIGFWFLGRIPSNLIDLSHPVGQLYAALILVSIPVAIVSVIRAMSGKIYPAAGWALTAVLLMTIARDCLRLEYLKPYFSLDILPQRAQYLPMVLFLLLFVGALYLTVWMIKLLHTSQEVQS
ncbi:MAG: hypothetical protein KJ950_15625 [Proteobacteria bacterium]|nr:hypothetical protein [Pseudomonadota bacterium]MBU1686956.1 hypothetical protein [Pseudomonadota bacterium]